MRLFSPLSAPAGPQMFPLVRKAARFWRDKVHISVLEVTVRDHSTLCLLGRSENGLLGCEGKE